MKSKTIWRLAILAVLFAVACVLGVMCLFRSCVAEIAPHPGEPIIQSEPTPAPYTAQGVLVESELPMLPEQTTPEATEQPESGMAEAFQVAGNLGTLTVGNKEIPIAGNVDEATLDKSPGWMPDSALPGESGMCVILGHRNRKHLRPLERVEIGDAISFTYPDGRTATYTVTETIIYENTADWRLPSAAGDTLVLVTCWPFRYSGSAPGKYVVISHKW